MALPGFRGTTYEVQTGDGARWIIARIFRVETEARSLADELLTSGRHAQVRITAKRDGWETEKVIFEANGQVTAKAIKPYPVALAPYCKTPEDCLRHPARLAVGRVGRAYLDERGITAAEFLVSPSDLMAVERRDGFFISAIHMLAKAQTSGTEKPASDRADILFKLHGLLRDQARKNEDEGEKLRAAVSEQGLAALPMGAPNEAPSFAVMSCLAGILATGGDWQGRLSKLLDLLEGEGGSVAARALVDQLIAEVLDGAQAITEILGGLREGIEACSHLIALATGAGKLPKFAKQSAHRLHALMGKMPLVATQHVLMERVARVLSSIKPLTQEGGDAERHAFTALIPTMLDPAGVLGGGPTAEALTLRSKMTLGNHEDLTLNVAIERLMDLFPNRAVRLGYLLDLMPTPTGLKTNDTIRGFLARLIGQLQSVRNLLPDGAPREGLTAAILGLRARLEMDTLPEEIRGALLLSLDRLLKGGSASGDTAPGGTALERPDPAPTKAAASGKVQRRDVGDGEILFEEGDEGHEAYLISDGAVDIYRVRGGKEEVIATLGRGEIIGEMSLIDDLPRAASARTRAGTSLVVISPDDLQKRMAALEKSDRLLKLLVDTLVRRLRGQTKGPA